MKYMKNLKVNFIYLAISAMIISAYGCLSPYPVITGAKPTEIPSYQLKDDGKAITTATKTGNWGIIEPDASKGATIRNMKPGATADTYTEDDNTPIFGHKRGDSIGIGIMNGTSENKKFQITLVEFIPNELANVARKWIYYPIEEVKVNSGEYRNFPIALVIPEEAVIPYKNWEFRFLITEVKASNMPLEVVISYISRWRVEMK